LLFHSGQKYHGERGTVGRLVLIDALGAAALTALWYFFFIRYNRRKGIRVLRSVEAACLGDGHIVHARWLSPLRLQAHIRFASHWFDRARVTVELRPRAIPYQWAWSVWQKRKETLTFEADLDYEPSLGLEVLRHRWFSGPVKPNSSRAWVVSRLTPIVFTTRPQWSPDLPPLVSTFMADRGHNLLSVKIRPESPHLAATIPLDTLTDERSAAGFLSVLRDLAAGASASRQ